MSKAESLDIRKENIMRLSSLTPSALTGAIEARLRHARHASRRARLRRELTRLPCYVARDIGVTLDHGASINFTD